MFDVEGVEADFFFEVEVAAAGNLREAGDAGFDCEQEFVVFFVVGNFFGNVGARANQTHVAFEHVPKLGKFVD